MKKAFAATALISLALACFAPLGLAQAQGLPGDRPQDQTQEASQEAKDALLKLRGFSSMLDRAKRMKAGDVMAMGYVDLAEMGEELGSGWNPGHPVWLLIAEEIKKDAQEMAKAVGGRIDAPARVKESEGLYLKALSAENIIALGRFLASGPGQDWMQFNKRALPLWDEAWERMIVSRFTDSSQKGEEMARPLIEARAQVLMALEDVVVSVSVAQEENGPMGGVMMSRLMASALAHVGAEWDDLAKSHAAQIESVIEFNKSPLGKANIRAMMAVSLGSDELFKEESELLNKLYGEALDRWKKLFEAKIKEKSV